MIQPAFHSEHHRRLDVLVGAWDTTITMLNHDGTAGDPSHASDVYTWMQMVISWSTKSTRKWASSACSQLRFSASMLRPVSPIAGATIVMAPPTTLRPRSTGSTR